MKVILLKNIPSLGQEGEIKEVKEGYARNYLIPNNLAKIATPELINQWQKRQQAKEAEQKEKSEQYLKLAEKLKTVKIELNLETGEKGSVFKSIGPEQISEKLKQMGYEIKPDQIQFKPTKKAGEYTSEAKLGYGISTKIKVVIAK